MFKWILAMAASLILAGTLFGNAAYAGGCNKGFHKQSFGASYKAKKAKRARLARQRALAKKRAAAKRRAIAKKKAAAKKARIAAAKKKARIAAAKKKAAEQKLAQQQAEEANAEEQKTAEANDETFDKPVSVAALAGADAEIDTETNIATGESKTKKNETSSNSEVSCKKFIPAAGLTVTVPCTL